MLTNQGLYLQLHCNNFRFCIHWEVAMYYIRLKKCE